MWTHRRALAAITAVLLTGCGSDTSDTAQTDQAAEKVEGAGVWEFVWNGATGTVEFPVQGESARVDKLEKWRQAAQAEPVTYLRMTADNTAGSETFEGTAVIVTTTTGEELTLRGWQGLHAEWKDAAYAAGPGDLRRGEADALPGDLGGAGWLHLHLPGRWPQGGRRSSTPTPTSTASPR